MSLARLPRPPPRRPWNAVSHHRYYAHTPPAPYATRAGPPVHHVSCVSGRQPTRTSPRRPHPGTPLERRSASAGRPGPTRPGRDARAARPPLPLPAVATKPGDGPGRGADRGERVGPPSGTLTTTLAPPARSPRVRGPDGRSHRRRRRLVAAGSPDPAPHARAPRLARHNPHAHSGSRARTRHTRGSRSSRRRR